MPVAICVPSGDHASVRTWVEETAEEPRGAASGYVVVFWRLMKCGNRVVFGGWKRDTVAVAIIHREREFSRIQKCKGGKDFEVYRGGEFARCERWWSKSRSALAQFGPSALHPACPEPFPTPARIAITIHTVYRIQVQTLMQVGLAEYGLLSRIGC
jgi:hypothetical protein